MCACTVSLQRKPNSVAEFTETIEHDIFPLRRTQQGFQDEMAFVVPGGTDAVRISVGDQQAHAEADARSTSPHVLKAVPGMRWRAMADSERCNLPREPCCWQWL